MKLKIIKKEYQGRKCIFRYSMTKKSEYRIKISFIRNDFSLETNLYNLFLWDTCMYLNTRSEYDVYEDTSYSKVKNIIHKLYTRKISYVKHYTMQYAYFINFL